MNEEYDFGFTAVDQDEVISTTLAPLSAEKEELREQLQSLYNAIIPLLKKLSANPEKDLINWPNRLEHVQKFNVQINKIVGTNVKTINL